ncbi:uncharacterized protein LOC111625331 isoform X1 [Centruroides sculpturatus]|uniref:uncharacterized protein LOC111625331 isoform X1 n=2 Tax=Centruroides sculpturatus TaxID=218467 RepID=UPI000C6ECD8E|nr:uncharacterized protein LOC111625331 isoform X1 [Centruroides sculpturatus]
MPKKHKKFDKNRLIWKMDQPVVVMERLPETVVEYYLQKLKKSGYNYKFSNLTLEKFRKSRRLHYRKKKQKKINAENPFDSEANEWEISNKNTSMTNNSSEKSNLLRILRQIKVPEPPLPIGGKYSNAIPSETSINTSIEGINNSNEIESTNNGENVNMETEAHANSLQNVKLSVANPPSSDCSDNFYNEEWQIISEASCSDASRSSSPFDEDCPYKSTENTNSYNAALSDRTKHSTNLENEECTNKNEVYKTIVLSECCDVYAFEEDDKLTEPYKSDCEDNDINSPLNLKISDTSEQYSEHSYKSQKDESVSNSSCKNDDKTEKTVLNNLSQIFSNSQSETFEDKSLQLTNQKQEMSSLSTSIFKIGYQSSNMKHSTSSESLQSEQMERNLPITKLLPAGLSITPIFQNSNDTNNENTLTSLKIMNKSDALNSKNIDDEAESLQLQNISDNKSSNNQYDVVGHILKTMDKSFSVTRKLSIENTENESTRSSENEKSPVRSDSSSICSFKQKKARMSMGSAKLLIHRDSSSDDASCISTSNKTMNLQNMADSKSGVKSKENYASSDSTDLNVKRINKRKSNIPLYTDTKKLKLYGYKKLRSCWRCGKKYTVQNSNDRLCRRCTLLDYTKLNNTNLKSCSDGECFSDKETVAGDQSDHSTVSEPCFSQFKLYKKFIKEAEHEQVPKSSKESSTVHSLSKDLTDKTNTFHNNPMDLSINKQDAQDKTTAVPPLKLIVSINQKNLKNSEDTEKTNFDLKFKKQRKKNSSINAHKMYKVHNIIHNSEHRENENLVCKILRKRKHKDLLKKRKKSKDNTDYETVEKVHSENSFNEKYESKLKKLKISKTSSETISLKDPVQTENFESTQNDKTKENPEKEKNKKGSCEVINVNRGLFLLSFPEEDDLDPNIFAFPEKSEIHNDESDAPLKISLTENATKDNQQKTDDASSVGSEKEVKNNEKTTPESASATNTTITVVSAVAATAEDLLTSPSDTLNKKSLPDVQTTNVPTDNVQEKSSELCSDNSHPIQTDPLDLMTKTANSKNSEIESSVVNKDLSVNKSIPKIENVFSLRDMPIERLQEDKLLRPIPSLSNYNVYNELDAYATASILELEQSQEHSVILLTSILAREFKELHKIHLMEKASQFSLELYKVKMRKIDTIRSLQLACILLTKGQKCKKELSPHMLDMSSEEMSQLLVLCNDMYHSKLSEAFSKSEEVSQNKSTSDKIDSNNVTKKNGVHSDISQQTLNIQNTINSLLMPPAYNPMPIIPASMNYGPHPNFHNPQNITMTVNKSDDDVICLGTSHLRTSVIHNSQPKEQITVSKVSQSKSFPVSVSNKDERIGNLTPKQAITLSELAKTNNLQVEASGNTKSPSQAINKVLSKNNQVTVNIVNNTPVYQKISFGFNENGNFTPPTNQSSTVAQRGADERKQSPQSQVDKTATSNWGPTNTTEVRNISRIQNQWTSQSLGKQGITITQTTTDRNAGSPAWRNNISAHSAVSVPNQQRPIQPNIRPSTLVPIINQFGTLVARPPLLQGNLPVPTGRNIASVPMFNIHTQGVIRTWHQPPNAPAQVSSHQSSQSPIVCITCRKPISMTCPTGMFCSEICKKTYCAMFPNYR